MANEPCKITVRDDLENGIQKYAELCAVITEKQSTIQDVIDCGRELASKAQSKAMVANNFGLNHAYHVSSFYVWF